jgi:hypothetical protein
MNNKLKVDCVYANRCMNKGKYCHICTMNEELTHQLMNYLYIETSEEKKNRKKIRFI